MLPRNLLIIFLASLVSLLCFQKAQRNKYAATISGVISLIENKYVDEVDRRKLFEGAMDGLVKGLDDPYSAYISPDAYNRFEEDLEQEFGGIGVVVEMNPKTKRLIIKDMMAGTPAYKAGLRTGDQIVAIDNHPIETLSLNEAVRQMRGKPGSMVALQILHPGGEEPEAYEISRAKIPVPSVLGDTRIPDGNWNFLMAENPRVAYLRVTTFGEHTVDEMKRALASVSGKCDGVIIDLRDNSGGLLFAAVGTCDLFLEEGKIVSTHGREGSIIKEDRKYDAKPDLAVKKDLPVVVLVNHYSASASEIVAACLQDQKRAVVVGERTWGKGTVQTVISLDGGKGAIKLTTASYWRPNGHNIHRRKDDKEQDDWGVRPNDGFEVKIEPNEAEKIARYRRYRDYFGNNKSPLAPPKKETAAETIPESKPEDSPEKITEKKTDDTPPGESPPAANTNDSDIPERVPDPQLQKGIDYILSKVNQKA